MEWLRLVGSLNHRSLLQKSPMKKTIYCKRDVYVRAYLGVTVTCHAVDTYIHRKFRFSQLITETHGDPRWNFNPKWLKSCFTVVVPGFPLNLYTKLTENPRQILTTFPMNMYGVATSSRLLQIIGLFCKRALWKRQYSAKETYNFNEPTHRSHPIVDIQVYTFNWRYPHEVQGGEDS